MPEPWNVLVVDDEPDIHAITDLAVKRKTWRDRGFKLTSANSGREARALLMESKVRFDVAIVDVVMETNDAGLQLCRFIRERLPLSVRIILRTGQPGVAPEDDVLNTYDIDQYLAKTEATPDKLYAALRMALRSSQDIASTLFFGAQLRTLAVALQDSNTTSATLFDILGRELSHLEQKHDVALAFVQGDESRGTASADSAVKAVRGAPAEAYLRLAPVTATDGNAWVMTTSVASSSAPEASSGILQRTRSLLRSLIDSDAASAESPLVSGFYVTSKLALDERARAELARDLSQCADAWSVSYALFQLQNAVIEKRVQAIESTRGGII